MEFGGAEVASVTANEAILLMETQNTQNTHQTELTKTPNTTTQPAGAQTLRRLTFSKPKSRIVENNHEIHEHVTLQVLSTDDGDSDSDDDQWDEDQEGGADGSTQSKYRKRKRRVKKRKVVEWVSFFAITTALICSLTVKSLEDKDIWRLKIWQWCVMIFTVICGRLVSGWVVGISVFFIEKNFMLREKVHYFVFGLRKSFQNVVWLALVLLSWCIMFSPNEVNRNHPNFRKVFRGLIAVLVGATIWLVKILLVKLLASSFHVTTFFDRMKESVFHHYILEMLSGPPLDETEQNEEKSRKLGHSLSLPARIKHARKLSMKRTGSRKIDMDRLRELSMLNTASAWSVKRLVNYVMSSGLSTISRTIDEFGKAKEEIASEWEARTCARRTFKNVAKPGAKYIEEEDLQRFLRREEVQTIFPLFEGALESGQIRKSAFRNWVVRAYHERKYLAHSLNDTKTAVQQLHKMASVVVLVMIIVVFLLMMGIATSKVIIVITSQLLLVGFMFQNTCKTIFESIIFVFVMHPFDVGDRCVIDGVQMIVEEMNILTTVFLRYDNEKIFYPNSVLSTKPISNFYRSPEMGDAVDFTIDVSTPMEEINSLKKSIQAYIESKPKYWYPKHSLIVKEIENLDKLKMCLCVCHTMNHQDYGERNIRRTELIFELKKIFEKLGIKYHLLPQEVHLTQVNTNSKILPVQA